MKAWLLKGFEGVSTLQLGEAPEPHARAGEVVMEVEYAALNPADRYLAEGQYPAQPPLPHVLGRDGVGTILEVGPGVQGVHRGDRRAILRGEVGVTRAGTLAQRVAVPAESLIEVPPGWTDEQAGSASLVYLTAYQALTQWGALPPTIVLITGASGGVGVAAIQLAKALGHKVVALTRSPEKCQRLRELGADAAYGSHKPNWPIALKHKARFRDQSVELAIDNIGGELFAQVIEVMGDRGQISVVGRLAGPVPQFNTATLFFRRLRIGGVAVGSYSNVEGHSAWGEVLKLLSRTGAKPVVDRLFAFDEAPQAFERLERGPIGKVVVKVKG